jgi:hypothetical protein
MRSTIDSESEGLKSEDLNMDLARLLGIMIVFGVPAIIGGGLVMHLLHSWLAVWLYEALLIFTAVRTAVRATSKSAPTEH